MPTTVVDHKFEFGQTVYLVTDIEQIPRIVTAIQLSPSGGITVNLCCGTLTSWHYEMEISAEKDTVLQNS